MDLTLNKQDRHCISDIGSLLSMVSISAPNRLRIRPTGTVSNRNMGPRNVLSNVSRNITLDDRSVPSCTVNDVLITLNTVTQHLLFHNGPSPHSFSHCLFVRLLLLFFFFCSCASSSYFCSMRIWLSIIWKSVSSGRQLFKNNGRLFRDFMCTRK